MFMGCKQVREMKLTTLKPRLAMAASRSATAPTLNAKRMTGRKVQGGRLRLCSADPHCARRGALAVYLEGFELDRKVSLNDGGVDTDENSQVLCVSRDAYGCKVGCHDVKTRQDMGYKSRK